MKAFPSTARRLLVAALLASVSVWIGACGDDSGTTGDYKSIAVQPSAATIGIGATQRFVVQATLTDDTTKDVTAEATFTTSDEKIATVAKDGTATGVATGVATITAKVGELSATAQLTVKEKKLLQINVAPPIATIGVGMEQKFTATANFDDGTTADVTETATWTSSDTKVATVAKGAATGVAAGEVTVTAESNGVTGTALLKVKLGLPKTIEVTPASADIAVAETKQFTATAILQDNSKIDVTGQVTWESSNTATATITTIGTATGKAKGTATITATYGSGTDAIKGTATLNVTDKKLAKVEVTPAGTSTNVGGKVNFTAMAIYSDNTSEDVTTKATWASNDTALATIDATGTATAVKAGTAQITATYLTVVSAPAILVINSTKVITAIEVTPAAPTAAKGTTVQFKAEATYSDNTKLNITSSAAWQSADVAIAIVDPANPGLATAKGAGKTDISATLDGVTGKATLTVGAATPKSITVSPVADQSLAKGSSLTFTAEATLTDNTTQDVTTQVTWLTNPTGIIGFTANVAKALAVGKTKVTAALAAYPAATSNTVNVEVTPVTLVSIAIDNPPTAALPVGATYQFTATGTYSDNSKQPLTTAVVWASSDATKATISNATGTQGLATAVAGGTTQITAKSGTISSTNVPLTVQTGVTLSYITITPATTTLNVGQSATFKAVGHYSDGSNYDITQSATWLAVGCSNLNPVNNFTVSKGDVVAVSSTATLCGGASGGYARVMAKFGAVQALAKVTIKETAITSIAVTCQGVNGGPITCVPAGIGMHVYCTAIATFADNTTGDITKTASWSSTVPAVATAAADGIITVTGAGTTVIRANQGGVTSPATGVVNATILGSLMQLTGGANAIWVYPQNNTMPKGATQQYTSDGLFQANPADANCAGIFLHWTTEIVNWGAVNTNVATVSNTVGTRGLVTAVAKGNTQIKATYGTFTGLYGELTVTDACLQSIKIDQKNPTYPTNVIVPLTLKGYYSDAPTTPVQLKPADVANAFFVPGCAGYFMDNGTWNLAVGAVDCAGITATANGCTGPVTDTTKVTVDSTAVVTALTVTPGEASISRGTNQDFVATATYGTYGQFNVSALSNWANTPGITGLTHAPYVPPTGFIPTAERFAHVGTVDGTTTVTAAYGTKTATASLTISGKVINNIAVTNVAPANCAGGYPVGVKLDLTATVYYSDGTTAVNPTGLTFASSNTGKLEIIPGTSNAMTVAPSAGTNPTVTASFQGKTSPAFPIVVHPITGGSAVVLTNMLFTEANGVVLDQNVTKPLGILGVYSNCGNVDISSLVTSASGNQNIVDVATSVWGTNVITKTTPTCTTAVPPVCTPVTLSFIKDALTRTLGINVGQTNCLSSVTVAPATVTLPKGSTQDYTATATSTVGTQTDVTALGTWTVPVGNTVYTSAGIVAGKQRFSAANEGDTVVTFTLTAGNVCKGGNVTQNTITGTANATVNAAAIQSVAISRTALGAGVATITIPVGEPLQLFATATMTAAPSPLNVTTAAGTVWSSQLSTTAAVSATGVLTGNALGQTTITVVTANGKTANLVVVVAACAGPTLGISSTGAGNLAIGQTRSYNATAYYGGACNITFTVTGAVAWKSSDTTKATIDSTGTALGVAAGSTNINYTYKTLTSPTIALNVIAVTLTNLYVNPGNITVYAGAAGAATLTVTARYSDGNFYDPPVVNWTIGDGTVVTIAGPKAGTNNKEYTITGLKAGATNYRANVGLVQSTLHTATVSAACITAINMTSPSGAVTIPQGVSFAPAYSCTTSDGSALACNPTFGTTNNAVVTFIAPGIAQVVGAPATAADINVSIVGCGGTNKTSTRTVTSGSATLSSLSLPATVSIAKGDTKAVPATGVYTNGTGAGSYDLSAVATYTSTNNVVVAPLAPNPGTGQLVAGQVDGTAYVTATYATKTSNQSTVNVSGRVLKTIAITADPNVEPAIVGAAQYPAGGFTLQLKATGTYSSGPVEDLTSQVAWSLDTPVVTGTSISTGGLLTTGTPTSATVQVVRAKLAPAPDQTFNVTIVPGAVTTIEVRNANGTAITNFNVAKGLEVQYTALVTIMGGTRYWATKNVTWNSSVPTVGTIGASGATGGLFKAVALGVTNLSGNKGSISSGPIAITVTNAAPASVYCKPATASVVPGGTAQLRAWVRLSDGTENEITTDVATGWFAYTSATNTTVSTAATFNFNIGDPKGLITGLVAGTAYGTPTYGGKVATGVDRCIVTVQ